MFRFVRYSFGYPIPDCPVPLRRLLYHTCYLISTIFQICLLVKSQKSRDEYSLSSASVNEQEMDLKVISEARKMQSLRLNNSYGRRLGLFGITYCYYPTKPSLLYLNYDILH